jgi:hypothetical protein
MQQHKGKRRKVEGRKKKGRKEGRTEGRREKSKKRKNARKKREKRILDGLGFYLFQQYSRNILSIPQEWIMFWNTV